MLISNILIGMFSRILAFSFCGFSSLCYCPSWHTLQLTLQDREKAKNTSYFQRTSVSWWTSIHHKRVVFVISKTFGSHPLLLAWLSFTGRGRVSVFSLFLVSNQNTWARHLHQASTISTPSKNKERSHVGWANTRTNEKEICTSCARTKINKKRDYKN